MLRTSGQLVHHLNAKPKPCDSCCYCVGCATPPALRKSTVGKMGLKGVPGLNLEGAAPELSRQRPGQQNGNAPQSNSGRNQTQQAGIAQQGGGGYNQRQQNQGQSNGRGQSDGGSRGGSRGGRGGRLASGSGGQRGYSSHTATELDW